MNDEVLQTLVCEVEKILNDRPITKLSDDPRDQLALTPNMLLLLQCNSSVPLGIFSKDDMYAKRWWRQANYLSNVFWKRWVKQYLPSLQTRPKWHYIRRNLKPGDLVLVCEENSSRGNWPLGLVIDVNTSQDGLVRSAKVKVCNTLKTRPVVKLCLLEESVTESD